MKTITQELKSLVELRGEMQRCLYKLNRLSNALGQKEMFTSFAYPLRERSALRRSSLDLTHALAAWRKAR